MIEVYKDVYDWNYLYPYVYNEAVLREKLTNDNEYWFPAENIDTGEIVGNGYLKKVNKYIVFIARLACKKKYQGRGLAGILGATCMKSLYKMNFFDGVIRLECDVRAKAYYSQKFVEKTGSIPYGFIPNYNNYADKRFYKKSKQEPFTAGKIEPVIMYFQPFNTFWKKRTNDINIYDDKRITEMYYSIRDKNKHKMKSDNVYIKKKTKKPQKSEFKINLDYYKAIVSIDGYMGEKKLKKILNLFKNWNLIEWRIPTTTTGLNCQKIALNYNFEVVGYNPGSNINNKIEDTILFNYFPNGIDFNQFKDLKLTDRNKPIVKSVLKFLDDSN